MIIQVFKPLDSDTETLQLNKMADISMSTSFVYTWRFSDVGDFSLVVEGGTRFEETLRPGNLLLVDYQYWVRIGDAVRSETAQGYEISITGTDMKGILLQRITLYGKQQDTGAMGYDVVQGSTETVLKHYIKNNITQPADAARRIPGFAIAPDQGRGIVKDTYMSRFEILSELVTKVCKNAEIGYGVEVDAGASQYIFDVVVPADLTEGQSVNNRVVFAVDRGNVATMTRTEGITGLRNAFYATKSGGTLVEDALTQLVYWEGESAPAGIHRRELHLNVSITEEVAGQELSDIIAAARKEATNYLATDSYDCDIKGDYRLGVDYNLGDYVTVRHEVMGTANKQITEALITYDSNGARSLKLTFGEKATKILNALNTKITNKGV